MNSGKASQKNRTGKSSLKSETGKSSLPALAAVNLLTGSRVFLSAGLVLCILSGESGRALALLAVIYGTDIMDGMLARRWHAVTRLGAHFDLAADIWFVVLACSALIINGFMPFWFLLAAAFKFAEFAATSYFLSAGMSGQRQSQIKGFPEAARSPVFDTVGRLSGILFMVAPVPAILLSRIMPFPVASLLLNSFAVCICILSLLSSGRRFYLCTSMIRSSLFSPKIVNRIIKTNQKNNVKLHLQALLLWYKI